MTGTFMKLVAIIACTPALLTIVSAQTHSECNPMEKSCPANPALSGNYDWEYGSAAPDFKILSGSAREGKDIIYGGKDGVALRVQPTVDNWKAGDAANPSHPTLVSNFYIMWGKLEMTMKAAPGAGIISSLVLQSDDLDEIDWEWVGSDTAKAQSNYFGKGVTDGYTRGATHAVSAQEFHTYGMEWTQEKLDWTIDGKVVRTLMYTDNPKYYPQTPCQVRFGSWSGGDSSNEEGTIQWAGGKTDYAAGPYDMLVKEIKVQDYSTGTQYEYSDKSGSYESIKAVGGKIGSGPSDKPGHTVGDQASASGSADSASASGSFQAPTKSNYIVSSSSTSEPTSNSGSDKAADSSETTQTPSSPESAHVTGSPSSGSDDPNNESGSDSGNTSISVIRITTVVPGTDCVCSKPTGYVPGPSGIVSVTGTGSTPQPTGNGTVPIAPGSPSTTAVYTGAAAAIGVAPGIMVGAVGLVLGWLL